MNDKIIFICSAIALINIYDRQRNALALGVPSEAALLEEITSIMKGKKTALAEFSFHHKATDFHIE